MKDWPDWTFEAAEKDDINDWSQQQGGTGLTSPRFSFLAQEGLLPELFVDRIRDRVIVDPKSEFLKKEALKCVETASNGDFTLEKRENSQNKRD